MTTISAAEKAAFDLRSAATKQLNTRNLESEKNRARNEAMLNSKIFRKACEMANIPPTKRQASKFRRNQGVAHRFYNQAKAEVMGS